MNYTLLGKTNITVSKLCFGSLTVGPLQAKMNPRDSAEVFVRAIELGINHIDTAQLYGTYEHIRQGLRLAGNPDVIISSKTYAYERKGAYEAVEEARKALERDVIDIFLLHEQESIHTIRGHEEALYELYRLKSIGVIKAVGLSTHHVAGVYGAIKQGLEIIHPMLNIDGHGIADGSRLDMEEAVRQAHEKEIGIFAMKALGGGNLWRRAEECFRYIIDLPYIDSVAVGMRSTEEIEANVSFFETGAFNKKPDYGDKILQIESWCEGCGKCIPACGQNALRITEGKAVCSPELCVLCGYCSTRCEYNAVKII